MLSGKPVIYTDLDGTLLDTLTYSCGPAAEALERVKGLGIPLVICTSKTRAEILYWREMLGNRHPFISENGGGIYVPSGYFGRPVPGSINSGGYQLVSLGTPYARLREAVASLRSSGFDIRGFGDMSPAEVSEATGLPVAQAQMALEREFDEPFFYQGNSGRLPELRAAIGRMGLNYTFGRLMHIMGGSDKGRAVRFLTGLYRAEYGNIITAAIGDSPNDAPMLGEVDYPFLVRKPEGVHDPAVTGERVIRVDGVGPEGWAEAAERCIGLLGLA